jgi:hypothetical protein
VLSLKRWALNQPERVRRVVRRYLVPPLGEPRKAALDVHLAHSLDRITSNKRGLGLFLVGKQLGGRGHYREAADVLTEAVTRVLPNTDFVIDAHLELGRSLYASRRYFPARTAFETLESMPHLAAGTRLVVVDWLQRIRWRMGEQLTRMAQRVTIPNNSTSNSQH